MLLLLCPSESNPIFGPKPTFLQGHMNKEYLPRFGLVTGK